MITHCRAPLILIAALTLAAGSARTASAAIFDIEGVVATCNALACGAAGITVGSPIGGFIDVDDAASGPDSTFTEIDVLFLELSVGDLTTNGPGSDIGSATLSTGPDGEIVSGTVVVNEEFDTGLGTAQVELTLDAATETWEAVTGFLGIGVIASGTLSFSRRADIDDDGVADNADNCIETFNPDQRDTNNDGIGNACDADLTNDCEINFLDLGVLKAVFFSNDADADFDGQGSVNFLDLAVMKASFFTPPGPSGIPNDCDP